MSDPTTEGLVAAGDRMADLLVRVADDLRWLTKYRLASPERPKTEEEIEEMRMAAAEWAVWRRPLDGDTEPR